MLRDLDVIIDSASWSPKPAPTPLLKRVGSRQVDVLGGLLYTAYVTRPPTVHGFHLCDYWAWLRYLPAIAASSDLRLCEDWDNVDSHQKAVLSDELGVGFTTQFVSEVFNCSDFTDTLYVVNVLSPTKFSLKSGAKRGPRKSPDYIARYGKSNYIVLECKGTQTSRASLQDAMTRGQQQKGNILAKKSVRIKHSLVAGLFIPQWLAKEGPCIYVSDPRRDALEDFLSEESRERIDNAITQIGLAKQFALAGLREVPTYLASTGLSDFGERPNAVVAEIRDGVESLTGDYHVVFDTADFQVRVPETTAQTRAKFLVKIPVSILKQLMGTTRIPDVIAELSRAQAAAPWEIHSAEGFAELNTPLGFGFRVEVELGL